MLYTIWIKKWLSVNKRSNIRDKTFVIPLPPKNTIDGSIRFAIKCLMMYIKEPWGDKFHENVRAQQTSSGTDNSLSVEGNMSVQYAVRPDQANVFGFEYSGLDSRYFKIIILGLKEHKLEKRKLLDSSGHWWKRRGQLGHYRYCIIHIYHSYGSTDHAKCKKRNFCDTNLSSLGNCYVKKLDQVFTIMK